MLYNKRLAGMLALACFLLLAVFPLQAQQEKEISGRVLLITGVDQYHDWKANSARLREILEDYGFEVVLTEDPWVLTTEGMKDYHGIVMVMNQDPRWPAPVEQAMVRHVKAGMGIGIIHSANNCFPGWAEFEDMVGLLWRIDDKYQAGHDRYGPLTVKIADKGHFITRGMDNFSITDELYRDLARFSDFRVLAEAFSRDKQKDYPIIMVKTYGKGRVFHTNLGHSTESMLSQGFQRTTTRGMLWAIKKDK